MMMWGLLNNFSSEKWGENFCNFPFEYIFLQLVPFSCFENIKNLHNFIGFYVNVIITGPFFVLLLLRPNFYLIFDFFSSEIRCRFFPYFLMMGKNRKGFWVKFLNIKIWFLLWAPPLWTSHNEFNWINQISIKFPNS